MRELDKVNLLMTPSGYKNGKLYSVLPNNGNGDMSVIRATSKTRINQYGFLETISLNVPSIDYSGSLCPSVLIEPQATNLLTYSQDLSNAIWTKNGSTLSLNSGVSPSNLNDASKLVADVTNGVHLILQNTTVTSGLNYTQSVYAKSAGYDFLQIVASTGFSPTTVNFNLLNGSSSVLVGNGVAKIEARNNGWFKCSFTVLADTLVSFGVIVLGVVDSISSLGNFIGDGVKGVELYAPQLEQGLESSSYIPTLATTVTRSQDIVTVTPPIDTVKIITTFEDNTTQIIESIPTTFTLPNGKIKNVVMKK
jgi:hypothetical protein